MAEKQQEHAHRIHDTVVHADIKFKKVGQRVAASVVILLFIGGGALYLGNSAIAVAHLLLLLPQ